MAPKKTNSSSKRVIPSDNIISTSEKLMRKLLEAGADDVVLNAATVFEQQTKFANNRIVKTGTSESQHISVFSVWKRRVVETSLKEFTDSNIDELVAKASKFAAHLPQSDSYDGIADGPFGYKELPYDRMIKSSGEKHADITEGAVNAALEEGAKRCSGILETHDWKSFLLTSHSVEAQDQGSSVYFSLRAFVDKEASGHKVAASRRMADVKFERLARTAAGFAVDAVNPKPGPIGKFDIVFEPFPFAILLERAGSAASAFDVDAGVSFLQGKMGKQIGNGKVTLTDDPLVPTGYGSTTYDSEGVPTRRTEIIRNGKLMTYLHNTSTAKRYKTKTTANAGLVSPHHWNLVLEPGNKSREELIGQVKDGIYVTNLWYTRFQNYVTGDFSTIPRDAIFLIKNGKLSGSVKGIRITSNMLDILKGIDSVGKESENIHPWEVDSSVITPPVLVKGVNITKPTA
jgi:PmbA protein